MTVCIAAIVNESGMIAMAADSRVAFGDFSADQGAIKYEMIGGRYLAMIAGNDVVYALPTINRIKAEILRTKTQDPDEIAEIAQENLCITRNKLIEAKILKRFNLTVDQFVASGKASFTEQVYYDLCSRIDKQDLSLQFLIAGYDTKDHPHLRICSVDDSPNDYDNLGFAAIGTGASTALSSLSFAVDHCAFGRQTGIEEAAYFVLSAKFMAESATDVGRDTYFMGITPKTIHNLYGFGAVDQLRNLWLKEGAPRHSKHAVRALKDLLYTREESFVDPAVMGRCAKHLDRANKKTLRKLMQITQKVIADHSETKQLSSQTSEDQR